ncbi:MAG: peptide deformylase [Deltaproteobacteria bacterium]|nr:MAG: peptide deformylase [Deltaproteobacteria bacterium]
MILKIVHYPDPVLKKISTPVEKFDKNLEKLIEDMFETMYAAPGVGLAAPQVAISKRILVIDVGLAEEGQHKADPKAIINPVITTKEEKIIWEEGCLSLPQLTLPMERSKKIIVEGFDAKGKPTKFFAEDLQAVAFQHEIDHLDGRLLVDKLSQLKRELYVKKLKALTQSGKIEEGKGPVYVG